MPSEDLCKLLFIYINLLVYVSGQMCQGTTCSECISSSSLCRWCTQRNFAAIASLRCDNITNLDISGCNDENIAKPVSFISYLKNESVTDGDANGKGVIQLQPQVVNIKSTLNFPKNISMTFRAARNYPVDLYFLFDLSSTMRLHKEKLAALSREMANKIQDISTNYRFGFGYFQDKVTLPFTAMLYSRWNSPCKNCSPPFGYRHILSLTDKIDDFVNAVRDANITGNIDRPEGGLDAIMQAVACEEEVGWRTEAHRLLIYSSDSTFHYAGDGKLAGIVLPNDGKCHLLNGTNTEELNQDYPSIGQISQKVSEKKVNIIFAILKSVEEEYIKLSNNILDSSMNVLQDDTSNVVDIVRTAYESVISEVKFRIDASNDTVVKLFSTCNSGQPKETRKCRGVSIGQEVKLDVQVYSTKCPKNKADWNKTVTISAVGLPDKITINLELECECNCEKEEFEETSSKKCNSKGTFECGICNCDEGRDGNTCECSQFDILESKNVTDCVRPNTTVKCMGRGECKCGLCYCETGYNGRYCECDANACELVDGQVCGGPERGRCVCEQCVCIGGFSGDKCDCPQSTANCQSEDGVVCSGKGHCNCGKCICDSGGYIGSKCEICPTCPGVCIDNRDCVECGVFKQGPLSPQQCTQKCSNLEIVDNIDDLNGTCQMKDIDGCKMIYRIIYLDGGNITIIAQKYKVCNQEVDAVPIIAGVMGGIVAIGLFLFALWKILTSLYDGIEYARFQQDIDQCQWAKETNPIYKGATSTYKNPLFDDLD